MSEANSPSAVAYATSLPLSCATDMTGELSVIPGAVSFSVLRQASNTTKCLALSGIFQNLKPSPTRPLRSPAGFERDCCSASRPTPICSDQLSLSGREYEDCSSPSTPTVEPPLAFAPGVGMLIAPLPFVFGGPAPCCPTPCDFPWANDPPLAITLSRMAVVQKVRSLPSMQRFSRLKMSCKAVHPSVALSRSLRKRK